jgi:hypothetical protein
MKNALQPTLNWDIRMEPLMINNTIDIGKMAIVRNDNNKLLSIVGDQYEPVSNAKLMHFTDALTKTGEFELMGFDELNQGKIVLAFLKNKQTNLKINGFLNEEYLFIGNSFDGTKRFHIGTASSLVRCENQFSTTLKVFSKKHNSLLNINDEIVSDILSIYNEKKQIFYKTFEEMELVRVDERIVDQLIKEVHVMLSYDSKAIQPKDWTTSPSMITLHNAIKREMKDLGNNAFGLFNGVTWYTTHDMRNSEARQSMINGTANRINKKAYSFCSKLKEYANN